MSTPEHLIAKAKAKFDLTETADQHSLYLLTEKLLALPLAEVQTAARQSDAPLEFKIAAKLASANDSRKGGAVIYGCMQALGHWHQGVAPHAAMARVLDEEIHDYRDLELLINHLSPELENASEIPPSCRQRRCRRGFRRGRRVVSNQCSVNGGLITVY